MDNRQTSSSSSLSQQSNRIEEVSTTFYQQKNHSVTECLNSYGIPLKPISKSTTIVALQENRQREKRELNQLNDRFASYIERVRFLEAQNKKLQIEINHLRVKWGSKTQALKEKYDIEIHEARHVIDETTKDRTVAELQAKRAEEETLKLKDKYELLLIERNSDRIKIELLEKQLTTNEADLNLFHRRLIDLEDEQKRAHHESQQLNVDIQRITKDLDNEILTRIKLENQKQSLNDEIYFLKQIHTEEIEELKQIKNLNTTINSTDFFKNELSNAVKNIRQEYEQLNQQQQIELQSWYQTKVTQAIQEIQSIRAIQKLENAHEQEEIKKLRILASDSQKDIMTMRQRNGELENRVRELEELIQIERNNNIQISNERNHQIEELKVHLENLERNYDELITTKSTLDSEISIYRKLLEGEENRECLKQIVTNIECDYSLTGESRTYSQSYQRTNDSQELEEQSFTDHNVDTGREHSPSGGRYHLSSKSDRNNNECIPSAIHEESIGLQDSNESSDRSTDYDSSIEDPNERLDRFGNNHLMLTSYIPYRPLFSTQTETTIFDQVYGSPRQRRPTSISLNTRPVPVTDYSSICRWTSSDMQSRKLKTKTFFDNITRREQQQPKAITPPSSDYTDAYLSAFAPKPFSTSRRIYRIAAPVFVNVAPIETILSINNSIKTSQTRFNKINNTSTSNSFDRIISSPPNLSSNYSSNFVPDISTKYIPVPHAQSSLTDQSNLLSYQKVDKPILSSPSQSLLPLPAIPTLSLTKISYKPAVAFQAAPSLLFANNIHQNSINERTVSSLSNTEKCVGRSETRVFQHDEDIHSPCTKKLSSFITPSFDSPDTLIETKTESEHTSTKELPIATTSSSKPIAISEQTLLNKYDTIIDQISAVLSSVSPLSSTVSNMSLDKSVLDYEFTTDGSPILQHKPIEPKSSQQTTTTTTTQRAKGKYLIRDDSYDKIVTAIADLDNQLTPPIEESITPAIEGHQISLLSEQVNDETKKEVEVLSTDERKLSSVTEQEEIEHPIASISSSDISTSEISSLNDTKLDVELTTEIASNKTELVQEQTRQFSDEVSFNKKNGKNITWNDTLVNDENQESISYQSLTEETSSSEASIIIDDQNNDVTSNESYTKLPNLIIERRIESSSSSEMSSAASDLSDRQTTTSDLNDSRSSEKEQIISSETSGEIQFVSTVNPQVEELKSNEAATSTKSEDRKSSLPIVESPINTLPDSISTRYISSDVYHGYLSDHPQFFENFTNMDNTNMKVSLLASLRQTIGTPATPLIETIQSVVSSMRTLAPLQPLKNENQVVDQSSNEMRLTTANKVNNEHEARIENELTAHTAKESKIMFENFDDTAMESTQTIISDSQIPNSTEEQSTLDTDTIIIESLLFEIVTLLSTKTVDAEHEELVSSDSIVPIDLSMQTSIGKNIRDNEKITQINIVPEVSDILTSEHVEIKTETTNRLAMIIEKIVSVKENQPLIEQDITFIPDQINIDQVVSIETIQEPSFLSQEKVRENFEFPSNNEVDDEKKINLTTILSQVSDNGITQSTIHQQPSDTFLLTYGLTPIEKTDKKIISTRSMMTNETTSTTNNNQNNEINLQIVDELIHDIIKIVVSQSEQKSMETNHEILFFTNDLTQSINSQISESDKIERLNPSDNSCELSSTTTDLDSLELINALRGHSIVLPNSSDQIYHPPPDRSPSTATSSQMTSSDCYISYAIHQMGDSSQERLPAFPIENDLPVYKNIEENLSSKPLISSHQIKEDDLTDFDATDNFTSHSDDSRLQSLHTSSTINKQENFNASSTDDDVDDEIEQSDLTDFEQIIDKLSQSNKHETPYQFYDLATTPSSNESSSSSRRQPDDIYYIPGYPGLWRPTTNNEKGNMPVDYDADDERRTASRTRTIIRTFDSTRRPVSFQQHDQKQSITSIHKENRPTDIPLRPDTINLLDQSESDSYHTCASSITKPIEKQSKESDPINLDESIFLIRQRERAVSLPITMKIDCNEIDLRLSTSSPIETQSYLQNQLDSSSSSFNHSEPLSPIKIDSNNPTNSSSWLNTINTITVESQISFFKSAKGPISISECHLQGNYIIIQNTSRSKTIDLTNWKIHQENEHGDLLIFTFPDHCLIKPNHSLKILTNTKQSEQKIDDLIAFSLFSWHTGPNIHTTLINPEGKDCATLTKKTIFS